MDDQKTTRLQRKLVDRVDAVVKQLAERVDVDGGDVGSETGVRISRSFVLGRAMDLYEEYLAQRDKKRKP